MGRDDSHTHFPSAETDKREQEETVATDATPQTLSPSYRLAFADEDFMLKRELRPIRLQLELLKPELLLQEEKIVSTVVVFGSARIPDQEAAKARRAEAEAKAAAAPEDAELRHALDRARRIERTSHYYET
ncbi:MAG TPA: 3-isopropylmalate dehydrogenase, partial [Arenibaculum sp.]|nr:3-isopropylmalate dehydrogenase [Arenibaculum sp.]